MQYPLHYKGVYVLMEKIDTGADKVRDSAQPAQRQRHDASSGVCPSAALATLYVVRNARSTSPSPTTPPASEGTS